MVGFFIGVNISMEQQELFERDTTAWVYESPDGGTTIYRRKLGDPHHKRELVKEVDDGYVDYSHWIYRQDWDELAKNPAVREYLDKLRVMVELVKQE